MKRRPACRVTPAPLCMPVPGSAKHLFVCLCDWAAWPGASHICPKSNAVDAGPTPCPSCRGVAALPSSREGAWPSLEHSGVLSHSPARLRQMKSPWAVAVWGQSWALQQLAVPVLHPRWPPLRAVICCLSAVASCISPELLQIPTRSGMGSWHCHHTMQHRTCCCAPQRDLPRAVLSRSSNQVLYRHQETMSSV